MTSTTSLQKDQIQALYKFTPTRPKKVVDHENTNEALRVIMDAGFRELRPREISPYDTAKAVFMISQLFSEQQGTYDTERYKSPEGFLIFLLSDWTTENNIRAELKRLNDEDRIYKESIIKEKFCNSLICCGEFINRLMENENKLANYPNEKKVLKDIIDRTQITFSNGVKKFEDFEKQKDKTSLEENLLTDIINDIDNATENKTLNPNILKSYIVGCIGRYDDLEKSSWSYFDNKIRFAFLKEQKLPRVRFSTNTSNDLGDELYKIGVQLGFFE